MKHFAAVKDGVVENVAIWNSSDEWHPGEGYIVAEVTDPHVGRGWTYDGKQFKPPVVREVAEVVDGIVVDVHGHDGRPLPFVAGPKTYIESTGLGVSPGWTYDGGKFAPKE